MLKASQINFYYNDPTLTRSPTKFTTNEVSKSIQFTVKQTHGGRKG